LSKEQRVIETVKNSKCLKKIEIPTIKKFELGLQTGV
jgi:hypothetical protein